MTPALVVYPEIIASNIERDFGVAGWRCGSLAGTHQDGEAGLHLADVGRARHPQLQMRDYAGTFGGLPAWRGGCSLGVSIRGRECAAGAGNRGGVSAGARFCFGGKHGAATAMARQSSRSFSRHKSWDEPHGHRAERQRTKLIRWWCAEEALLQGGLEFRGLHYYCGQHRGAVDDLRERTAVAHRGYDRLLEIVKEIERIAVRVPEVDYGGNADGTAPRFPLRAFCNAGFLHRVSPGTVVYCDALQACRCFPRSTAIDRRSSF